MEVSPLLHFGNYAKVTAIDVHPHDRLCAVATNNGCIYTLPLSFIEEDLQHGELNITSQRVSLVVKLSTPATQLAWARWRSGRILGALIGSKMARLLSRGSDGSWKEVEFLDVPECNFLAFSPLKYELACACTGGKLVVLKRTGDVWTTKWSDGPEGVKGTNKKDALCVAWSDNGLLSMGDNEGFVRVFNVQRTPREIMLEQLAGTVQHVAFAPTLARSFTLMATATQDMIVVYALSNPTVDEKDGASQTKAVVDMDHSFGSAHNRKRVPEAQRLGKDGRGIMVGCVSLSLGSEMASRLRWNSMGNTLCCSLVDGAIRMYRLHCRYRTRQHDGRGDAQTAQTLELDLEEVGSAIAPFHYDQVVDL